MDADWVSRGIAIGAATVALVSLGWNIVAWRRQGPVLRLRAKCAGRGMRCDYRNHSERGSFSGSSREGKDWLEFV
jgi:hypothetical protein